MQIKTNFTIVLHGTSLFPLFLHYLFAYTLLMGFKSFIKYNLNEIIEEQCLMEIHCEHHNIILHL
jgi:hypothetical protein